MLNPSNWNCQISDLEIFYISYCIVLHYILEAGLNKYFFLKYYFCLFGQDTKSWPPSPILLQFFPFVFGVFFFSCFLRLGLTLFSLFLSSNFRSCIVIGNCLHRESKPSLLINHALLDSLGGLSLNTNNAIVYWGFLFGLGGGFAIFI